MRGLLSPLKTTLATNIFGIRFYSSRRYTLRNSNIANKRTKKLKSAPINYGADLLRPISESIAGYREVLLGN